MKYIQYTYVDAVTGISIAAQPAANGPAHPEVEGLEFVWARESEYPTNLPALFGACPDSSDIKIDGVAGEFIEIDWLQMQADEMNARLQKKQKSMVVTMRQARLALLQQGLLASIQPAIDSLDEPHRSGANIEWEYSQEVERNRPFVELLSQALGLTDDDLDALFELAATL